jgi:hypothetical protein
MNLAMSKDYREEFLSEVRVAVLGVVDPRGQRAPLQVPVWYGYKPGGDVVVLTGRDSLKARFIAEAGRFGICVQDETAPYRYVSVEGPVVAVDDPMDPMVREAMAHRYLDAVTASAYLEVNQNQLAEDIALYMRPQYWRTADFSTYAKAFS